MCDKCHAEMEQMGVDPNSLVQQMGMAMEGELARREAENDMRIRLAALELAVKVKGMPDAEGKPASSQAVLSSAHAYYAFITNNTKDAK